MTTTISEKTVMLYATVDTFALDRGPAAFALGLCGAAGAALMGFLVNLDANAPSSPVGRTLEQAREDFRLRADTNAANADALIARGAQTGLDVQVIAALDHSRGLVGCLADHARLHDVLVIGADQRGLMSDRLVAESVLFEIGRPMIVVPQDQAAAFASRRVAVAWDNSRAAARALADALSVLPGVEEVIFLTIGGEKAVHSSLAESEMETALARRGVSARVVRHELRGRDIGTALQDGALELGADVLAMGGYGHSRLRDFILGGATLSVLAKPRLPVLLSH